MDAGVSVDSYGRCLHNREEGRREGGDRNGGAKKIDLLRQYKFAIAFENSPLTVRPQVPIISYGVVMNQFDTHTFTVLLRFPRVVHPVCTALLFVRTQDYTTEKFTQALIAGAIPITLGPPNIRDFAPAPDSFIAAESFDSPAQLALAVPTPYTALAVCVCVSVCVCVCV